MRTAARVRTRRRLARVLATCALLATLALAGPMGAAETLGVGDPFPTIDLLDQHGEPHAVDASVRLVIFTRDMKAGGVVREALEEEGAALLSRHGTVYVSDVSRMPAFIRRTVAKPRMRRRPYPVLLDERGDATATLPSEAGQATLLFLDALRITRLERVGSVEALRTALARHAPEDPAPAE